MESVMYCGWSCISLMSVMNVYECKLALHKHYVISYSFPSEAFSPAQLVCLSVFMFVPVSAESYQS